MPTSTKPVPVRVISRDFNATLPASKAAGVVTIRLAQDKGDVTVEELNAKQQAVSSFRMHALVNSAKKITAVAVTEMGGSSTPKPFTAAQKAAFGRISAELQKVKTTTTTQPTVPVHEAAGHELSPHGFVSDFLDALDVTLACGAAVIEGGANPLADAACVAASAAAGMNEYEESGSSGDGNGSEDDDNGGDDSGGDDSGGDGDPDDTGTDTKHQQR